MRIALSVGHSILRYGACTSADGRPFGGVLEYTYNKAIVERVAAYLRAAGHTAEVIICPELKFTRSAEEKSYKVPKVNGGGYDLVVELHLNASKYHNARGCEVLYICEKGKEIAQRIQEQLSSAFPSRGVQWRTDLYMLTKTKPVALIVESFFCDNAKDCELAEKTDVAKLIAQGIHGGTIPKDGQEPETPDEQGTQTGILYRVQTGAFTNKGNAVALRDGLEARGFDAFIAAVDVGGRLLYRVQVGAYGSRANAENMQKKLEKAGFATYLVAA